MQTPRACSAPHLPEEIIRGVEYSAQVRRREKGDKEKGRGRKEGMNWERREEKEKDRVRVQGSP